MESQPEWFTPERLEVGQVYGTKNDVTYVKIMSISSKDMEISAHQNTIEKAKFVDATFWTYTLDGKHTVKGLDNDPRHTLDLTKCYAGPGKTYKFPVETQEDIKIMKPLSFVRKGV